MIIRTKALKRISAFATFKDFADKETSLFHVLDLFMAYTADVNRRKLLSADEMVDLLFNEFEFKIYPAVVKKILRKSQYFIRLDKNYQRNDKILAEGFCENIKEEECTESILIQEMISFVENETLEKLTEEESQKLAHDFCLYLLDKTISDTNYFGLISKFLLSKGEDKKTIQTLNKIKAGMVLYNGITYESDDPNTSSWSEKITLILNTDVLFSIAGYNGELCQRCGDDFLELVKFANRGNEESLIRLRYLEMTMDEIINYFDKAKDIVKGRSVRVPNATAMKNIVEKCKSPSDVAIEFGRFKDLLSELTIESQPCHYSFDSLKDTNFNIERIDALSEVSPENENEAFKDWELLNRISFLRNCRFAYTKDKAIYTLITDKRSILNYSNLVRQDKQIGLADDLESYVSYLWFKLNKRIQHKELPSSFNIILKTQQLLASTLGDKILDIYEETKAKFDRGEIDQQSVERSIVALNQYAKMAESITSDNAEKVWDSVNNLTISNIEQEYVEKLTELENAKDNLFSTKTELETTKEELHNAVTALEGTQTILSNTQTVLSGTKGELSNTKEELNQTKKKLSQTERELIEYKQHKKKRVLPFIVAKTYLKILCFPLIIIAIIVLSILENMYNIINSPWDCIVCIIGGLGSLIFSLLKKDEIIDCFHIKKTIKDISVQYDKRHNL